MRREAPASHPQGWHFRLAPQSLPGHTCGLDSCGLGVGHGVGQRIELGAAQVCLAVVLNEGK